MLNSAIFTDDDELNPCIVEDAGYIPLSVRFKKYQEDGIINKLREENFESHALVEAYNNPDFNINFDDDLEDVMQKLSARDEFIKSYSRQLANEEASPTGNNSVIDSGTTTSDITSTNSNSNSGVTSVS